MFNIHKTIKYGWINSQTDTLGHTDKTRKKLDSTKIKKN
jgi:hypothetical protein